MATQTSRPDMNCRALAYRLTALRPDMRALNFSGYTAESISHYGVLDAGIALVDRPAVFAIDSLSAKLREILDAPESPGRSADGSDPSRLTFDQSRQLRD